jgi:branched-chain amino acid transport system ATP-binding protein
VTGLAGGESPREPAPPLLEVDGLHAYYGASHVLFGVSLRAGAGEVVALLGRNGAGKTTTLRSIMGLLPPRAGRVRFRGRDITGWPAYRVSRLGIGLVPEDRRIFADLTVEENLEVGRRAAPAAASPPRGAAATPAAAGWTAERVYEFFPVLGERRRQKGGTLSGGEQQMLTIARTLMGNPALLLLDEPSEGLAPVVVRALLDRLLALKAEGQALLLSEQNLRVATRVSDRAYVLEQGHVRYAGTIAELEADQEVRRAYLLV